ncbi:hypothetical protein [Bradyrhizobium australafricanum]|uniref:hypothetical protein n=1 Tax=Bradyrhizobium australafricanum TaxID=2821406 RepID=UPI001CE24F0F|nr:hypothetical protein [Bradyrhizobium australafricanum]MCA6104669.1 hypothetical protein [Bradyrhizobium australafricanum]
MKSRACSLEQAQWGICHALSDGVIEFRARLEHHHSRQQTSKDIVSGNNLQIPTDLTPDDIDWQESRPKKPWRLRELPRHHPGLWSIAGIELSSIDVMAKLLPGAAAPGAPQSDKPKRKHRERPQRTAAETAINAIWAKDVPPAHELVNDRLVDRVSKWLEQKGLPKVSRDTILRAAGRK